MAPKKSKTSSFLNYTQMASHDNVTLTDDQFSQLIGNLKSRTERSTFSTCTARFNGTRKPTNVDNFIATILVYKALFSFPFLLKGCASSWWQGIKTKAKTLDNAIQLLCTNFSPPKPDWRLFAELFQDKQKTQEMFLYVENEKYLLSFRKGLMKKPC